MAIVGYKHQDDQSKAIRVIEAQDASFSVVRHTGSLATIDMFQLERREDRGYGWVPEHIKFIPRY